ncbi:enoyl-CoA hydratase/isomerase family protein [Nocardia rosealba]|uniref:enoyl-CoA hydratase/isomerase family protein n=1 Tax=Nocardia rosealba TaxID=2878563 RepID=UPI001CDA2BE7|nr:enoyl-CoA hydratase-related protein [Nocardia rosealba]MCA2207918.1 enoyl-CoA hydratase/isomerase family protein [Nocardia rosealba]
MSGVRIEICDGVAVVTLDRPQRRNAFTAAMGHALGRAYRDLDVDAAVRVIVLTGAAPAFCAGADLGGGTATFDGPDRATFSASPVDPPAFALRKPVIAAVNGHAIGIGLTLAMQADIRLVADDARYAVPQVRLGVVPDAMAHWTVAKVAGMSVAADILLSGRTFDGVEAVRLGLASRCLPAAEVLPAALTMATDMATYASPTSMAASKRLLWDAAIHGYGPARVAELETELHLRVMGSHDAVEGMRARLDHRAPVWAALSSECQDRTPS